MYIRSFQSNCGPSERWTNTRIVLLLLPFLLVRNQAYGWAQFAKSRIIELLLLNVHSYNLARHITNSQHIKRAVRKRLYFVFTFTSILYLLTHIRAARYEFGTERSWGHLHFPDIVLSAGSVGTGWWTMMMKRGKHGIQNLYVVHVGWGEVLSYYFSAGDWSCHASKNHQELSTKQQIAKSFTT